MTNENYSKMETEIAHAIHKALMSSDSLSSVFNERYLAILAMGIADTTAKDINRTVATHEQTASMMRESASAGILT